ncbi:DUF433 domain-containing protein [candidate division KSB1 bacterium]|nr:DUF433 domain-containing protein [candidate division KSB1 bacterium]
MSKRILIDPKICHGKPVIKGTRVLVRNILGSLASGETIEEILDDYPNITKEDVFAALDFGCELSDFESHSYEVKAS